MILSILWSEDIAQASRQLRLFGYWIIIPLIYVVAKKEYATMMIGAFLSGMFVSEILAYGIFFDIWSINGRNPDYPTPFMTHIHYSVFLAFTSLVLLYQMLHKNISFWYKISIGLFFTTSTLNLMISTGRTGQLAFFVTLFFVIITKFKISIKSFFVSLTLLLSVLYFSYNYIPLFQKRANMALNDMTHIVSQNYNSSFGIRAAWWIVTYDALKEKPILGYGLGGYQQAAKQMLNKYQYKGLNNYLQKYLCKAHYHNQYLMVAVQGGILGLFLMFLMFYKLFRLYIDDKNMQDISRIGILVVLCGFIGEPLWLLHFPLMLFLFIFSISLVASKNKLNEEKQ
jgi:O-antigen ligase